MTADWKRCCDKSMVKEIKPDHEMIKSLVKSGKNKLESQGKLEMNDVTAASKFSLAYDSLREVLEALALKNNYKIYNHECYTAFLKEIVQKSDLGDEFDEIRKVRNAVNYYGKDISVAEAEKLIARIKILRNTALGLLGI